MKYRICASAIIRKDTQILLGQKKPGQGPYPDTWHIPGGGVNLGEETCDEAIVREVKEETGLEVKNLEKARWQTDLEPDKYGEDTYYVFLVYQCEYASGEVVAGDDMHSFEWVDIKKLDQYNLNRPTKIFFKQLGLIT